MRIERMDWRGPSAAARGMVSDVALSRNSGGFPWVSFALRTASGVLQCVCFPRSYAPMASLLTPGGTVEVRGKPMTTGTLTLVVTEAERVA